MKEKLLNDLMIRLDKIIPNENIEIIRRELSVILQDYEVSERETSIKLYNNPIPESYKAYIISRKIEGLSLNTLSNYDLYLKDFFYFVNKDIQKITTNDIRVYLYTVQKERNISNRTLDSRRATIHAFMEWCTNEGYIDKNPCRAIKPIKYERKPRKALTSMELERVRNACTTLKDKAIIEVLYSTGCRVSELTTLNINDVNFETKEVQLFGKGSVHRQSYLNAKAEFALKNYLNSRVDDNPALFVSDRKPYNRMKKCGIEKRVKLIGETSGIERQLFPHIFRHTNASNSIAHGMPIEEVQKLLGHSNINTTLIYAKVSQEDIKHSHKKYVI